MTKLSLTRNTRARLRKVEKIARKVLTTKKKCGNICKPFEERITSQDAGNLRLSGKKKKLKKHLTSSCRYDIIAEHLKRV